MKFAFYCTFIMIILKVLNVINVALWVCFLPIFIDFGLILLVILYVVFKILFQTIYEKWKNL